MISMQARMMSSPGKFIAIYSFYIYYFINTIYQYNLIIFPKIQTERM